LERRLAAILAADVVGYTALMGADEAGTLERLTGLRQNFLEPLIADHHGRVVKLMGDGILVEFASVVDAVSCALAWQAGVAERDDALKFRIGINLGDVIVEGEDIHGDGVNVASRLEGLAESGGICLSGDAYRQTRGKVEAPFEDLGEQALKNVAEPVRVYHCVPDGPATGKASRPTAPAKRSLPVGVLAGGLALLVILAGLLFWQRPWTPREEPASEANMAFPLPEKPSIAVLPFNNMSEDQGQEYFADGMTEDLITDLSKISGLFVIARNSSFSYKGQQVKVRQVAEELGVRYVLEGSVRRAGDEVRINAQLIDATTGGHLWAERYDGTLDDIFRPPTTRTCKAGRATSWGPLRRSGTRHPSSRRPCASIPAMPRPTRRWRRSIGTSMSTTGPSISACPRRAPRPARTSIWKRRSSGRSPWPTRFRPRSWRRGSFMTTRCWKPRRPLLWMRTTQRL
jgi:TolB-like protein/class 3 adenylate cyclase